jgi:hypothetical protein
LDKETQVAGSVGNAGLLETANAGLLGMSIAAPPAAAAPARNLLRFKVIVDPLVVHGGPVD